MRLPYVVVESGPEVLADARAELERVGWEVVDVDLAWPLEEHPGGPPAAPVVLAGSVTGSEDAGHAVLAAVAGHGLLLAARAERDVVDRLCEDLRRLGYLEHRVGPAVGVLDAEQHALLDLLGEGTTLGDAAARLHLSRRSADRRLAAARRALRVESTGAAVAAHRRRLDRLPRPPPASLSP